jgi:hypothetical protein
MENNREENVGVDFGLFGFVDFDDLDENIDTQAQGRFLGSPGDM